MKFIKYNISFIFAVVLLSLIHYGISYFFNLSGANLIFKLYAIIGLLTYVILLIAYFAKYKFPNHIGSVFMVGMIAKMAIMLAILIKKPEIKLHYYHLIISYFLILIIEVFSFIDLLKEKPKKNNNDF